MGGSSGGGGGSGKIGYPAYVETAHGDWLDFNGTDLMTDSVAALMEAAHGNSPWVAAAAYDPDADITAWEAAIAAFAVILAGINDTADWVTLYTQAQTSVGISDTTIVADVAAFANQLDDEILTKVLPRFRRGMQDIGAVVSSAFALGEAVIEGFRDRDVAKHGSALRLNAANLNAQLELSATEQMLKLMIQRIGWEDSYVRTVIEGKRIKVVAKKEQNDMDDEIDAKDATWDLEVYQYGANLLGAPGGAAVSPRRPSTIQSALGGAMTGAAAGGMIGGPPGALLGGILGFGMAFL